jgi:hypothetical protein
MRDSLLAVKLQQDIIILKIKKEKTKMIEG